MVRVNGKYGKTINPYTVHHKSITMHLTHEILLRNWAEKIKTSLKNEILSQNNNDQYFNQDKPGKYCHQKSGGMRNIDMR